MIAVGIDIQELVSRVHETAEVLKQRTQTLKSAHEAVRSAEKARNLAFEDLRKAQGELLTAAVGTAALEDSDWM
jgi:hypothetical protein